MSRSAIDLKFMASIDVKLATIDVKLATIDVKLATIDLKFQIFKLHWFKVQN